MTLAVVLAQHIDQPDDPAARHRCVLLDPLRLRCLDCARTIELRSTQVPGQSTSTSPSPARLDSPDRCERHPGQRQGACGPCRAEHLERIGERNPFNSTADVARGAAACRAALQREEHADA